MAITNKNNLLILIGVLVALGLIAGAYFMGQSSLAQQKAEMEAKIAALTKEKEAAPVMAPTTTPTQAPIKLESLLKKAEDIYSESEKNRTEGFLWVDRQGQNFIVTLGAFNGLETGHELAVYDANNRIIDSVKVELPFDSIAYVKPLKKSLSSFNDSYYRVVKED